MKKLEKMSLTNVLNKLTRSQMNKIMAGSGTNMETSAGNQCDWDDYHKVWINYDYGYDVQRPNAPDGAYLITYHNRTNVTTDCPIGNGG